MGIENHDIYLAKVIRNTVLPKVDQASFVSRYFLVVFIGELILRKY